MDFWVESAHGASGAVPHLWLCIAALREAQRCGADAFLVKEEGQRATRYSVSSVVAALVKDPSLNAYRNLSMNMVDAPQPAPMRVQKMKQTRGGLLVPV